MVDALGEIRRVLVPGGTLLDIRPLEAGWPVEVATETRFTHIGSLTDLPEALADDGAAEGAIAEAGDRGWFHMEQKENFPFFYYWDRPSEMKEFVETEWEGFEKLEEGVLRAAQAAWATANAEARVRVRVNIQIARWRRR
jgi:hypothetical protein